MHPVPTSTAMHVTPAAAPGTRPALTEPCDCPFEDFLVGMRTQLVCQVDPAMCELRRRCQSELQRLECETYAVPTPEPEEPRNSRTSGSSLVSCGGQPKLHGVWDLEAVSKVENVLVVMRWISLKRLH